MLALPDRRFLRIPPQDAGTGECESRGGQSRTEASDDVIFGQDRRELRQMYGDAWRKAQAGEVLSALEAQIVQVIEDHPEYRADVVSEDLERSYTPEEGRTNPFLHMGLHLALRDQVATDRPPGIREAFSKLAARSGDRLAAEHHAIDCLAETLWEAQRANTAPDEQVYLEKLRRLM